MTTVSQACQCSRVMVCYLYMKPQPPPAPEQAVVWLERTLEIHGHVLEADRKERVRVCSLWGGM